ncbi:major facilitator superfamily transporter [Colletotrichum gloeosporioides Cg-14]|uniref:Lysosomal dipeptide transporter MFSD1 n=1 Tax=Colletotrichum gloeosporioides (strain Cg-14) TaxID=1237896 RepID=T0K7L0_COLGC|nr:major facilitator superfamily transporter [Colletotrichum gloeosporioides Cg-14]
MAYCVPRNWMTPVDTSGPPKSHSHPANRKTTPRQGAQCCIGGVWTAVATSSICNIVVQNTLSCLALDFTTADADVATPVRFDSDADEKRIADVSSSPSGHPVEIRDFPWTWKLTALICGVALSWGSSFSENTLGPLKSTLIKQLDITNSQILAHWFQHKGLGLVYGLDLSIGKLIVLIAKATAVPMRDASSFWGWALWIPAIVCFANLIQNIFYVWWARSRPEWTQMPTGQKLATEIRARERVQREQNNEVATFRTRATARSLSALPNWGALLRVPRFFWLVACTQILQTGVVGGFNGLNADIITQTRGSTAQLAGYTSAVQQVIPVVCASLIGSFFDYVGYRMMFVSLTSAIWILVYCLIGYTQTNALGSMVIASVASTMNALPFLASIPLIVPNQLELGLVFGIWKVFNNSGSVIVDMIARRLQDITPGGTYERVVAFFVAVKGLEFCLGLFYGILDRKYLAGILSISNKKRMNIEKEGKLGDLVGRRPARSFTAVGIALVCSLIIIAWVLFIKYSF